MEKVSSGEIFLEKSKILHENNSVLKFYHADWQLEGLVMKQQGSKYKTNNTKYFKKHSSKLNSITQ
jgi:hypothetical protein